jgi:hypothetical protein
MTGWRTLSAPTYGVSYEGQAAELPAGTRCRNPLGHAAGMPDTIVVEVERETSVHPFWFVTTASLEWEAVERPSLGAALNRAGRLARKLNEHAASERGVGSTIWTHALWADGSIRSHLQQVLPGGTLVPAFEREGERS